MHVVVKGLWTNLSKFTKLRRRPKHLILVLRKGRTRAVDFPSSALLLSGFWPLRRYQMTRVGFQYTNDRPCHCRNAAYTYFCNPRFWKLAAERNLNYFLEWCSRWRGGLFYRRGRERLKKCQNCINPTKGCIWTPADRPGLRDTEHKGVFIRTYTIHCWGGNSNGADLPGFPRASINKIKWTFCNVHAESRELCSGNVGIPVSIWWGFGLDNAAYLETLWIPPRAFFCGSLHKICIFYEVHPPLWPLCFPFWKPSTHVGGLNPKKWP